MHIEQLLKRYSVSFSAAKRQRVLPSRRALAMGRPDVILLMDEPLSNLDALLAARNAGRVEGVLAESKTTTILSPRSGSSDVRASRLISVNDGGRIVSGRPTRSRSYPQPAGARFAAVSPATRR